MSRRLRLLVTGAAVIAAIAVPLEQPPPARASIFSAACGLLGSVGPSWLGDACNAVTDPGKAVGVAKKLLGLAKGLLGGASKHVLSPSGAVGIAAIVAWAVGGAHFVLSETAKLVGQSTSPELTATWFTSVYWRVAGVGALLTLPFLVAAAIQALLRSDGALLGRAVFAYLPLSLLATGVAAPIVMMLLALTDWMGAAVAQAAGGQGSHFLVESGVALGALGVAVGSPFVTFLIALLTAAAGLILWLELLVREAAVYVVVLMLPLVFAAMVWPARRVWAIRSVEVLVALVLAKFAIVAVLALAAAALGHGGGSLIVRSLAGVVLVALGAFAPWVLLRLLPLSEVAASAAGHLREHAQARVRGDAGLAGRGYAAVSDNVGNLIARMQRFHEEAAGDVSARGERGSVAVEEPLTGADSATGAEATGAETRVAPSPVPSSSAPGGPSVPQQTETGVRAEPQPRATAPTVAPTDAADSRADGPADGAWQKFTPPELGLEATEGHEEIGPSLPPEQPDPPAEP